MRSLGLACLALIGPLDCGRTVNVEFAAADALPDVQPVVRVLEGRVIRTVPPTPLRTPPSESAEQAPPPPLPPQTVRPPRNVAQPRRRPELPPGSTFLPDGTFVQLRVAADGSLRATILGVPEPEEPVTVAPAGPETPAPPQPPPAPAAPVVAVAPREPAATPAPALAQDEPGDGPDEEAAPSAGPADVVQVPVYVQYFYPWPWLLAGDAFAPEVMAPPRSPWDQPGPFGFGPRPVYPNPGVPFAPLGANSATSPTPRFP